MSKDLERPGAMLTEQGARAHEAIVALLKRRGMTETGGCKAFYSTFEWIEERGEEYGHGSVLIVVHDGGDLAPFFSYDYEAYDHVEEMRKALEKVGCYAEQCTSWYSAVYPIR